MSGGLKAGQGEKKSKEVHKVKEGGRQGKSNKEGGEVS